MNSLLFMPVGFFPLFMSGSFKRKWGHALHLVIWLKQKKEQAAFRLSLFLFVKSLCMG